MIASLEVAIFADESCLGNQFQGRANPGGATRITRVLLMTEPAAIDAGEITDKGYINQRAVLARRADLVERLYAAPADDDVVTIG